MQLNFVMLMHCAFHYLVEIVAVVVMVTTTAIATARCLSWIRHCVQQTLYITSKIPKLHNNGVVLFLVLEVEKQSFTEAQCPGVSRMSSSWSVVPDQQDQHHLGTS